MRIAINCFFALLLFLSFSVIAGELPDNFMGYKFGTSRNVIEKALTSKGYSYKTYGSFSFEKSLRVENYKLGKRKFVLWLSFYEDSLWSFSFLGGKFLLSGVGKYGYEQVLDDIIYFEAVFQNKYGNSDFSRIPPPKQYLQEINTVHKWNKERQTAGIRIWSDGYSYAIAAAYVDDNRFKEIVLKREKESEESNIDDATNDF